jgi:hypothetical protein
MVLASATAVTALADGPSIIIKWEWDEPSDFVFFCGGDIGVGDFWILNRSVGWGLDQRWADENNLTYRLKRHFRSSEHFYASFDPTMTNVVIGHHVLNMDLRYDPPVPFPPWVHVPTEGHSSGNRMSVQLPGSGNVIHVTLNIFTENGMRVKVAGLETWDIVTLCEYFGQFAPAP